MASVTVLVDVTAAVKGSTKKLIKGNTYELPDDVAKELARDGYVEISSGSARLQEKAEMTNPDDVPDKRGRFNQVPELGDETATRRATVIREEPESNSVDIYAEHQAEKHRIEQSIADRIADTFKDPGDKTEDTVDDTVEDDSLEDIHAEHESQKAEIEQGVADGNKDTAREVVNADEGEHVALITEEPAMKPSKTKSDEVLDSRDAPIIGKQETKVDSKTKQASERKHKGTSD